MPHDPMRSVNKHVFNWVTELRIGVPNLATL